MFMKLSSPAYKEYNSIVRLCVILHTLYCVKTSQPDMNMKMLNLSEQQDKKQVDEEP